MSAHDSAEHDHDSQLLELLPALVRDWVELMGMAPTMALVRAYPGVQLKVPYGEREGRMSRTLIRLLGNAAAQAFMARHGGEHLCVPRCAQLTRALRDSCICTAYDRGETVHALALEYGLTVRQLRNVLKQPAAVRHDGRPVASASLRAGDGNPAQLDLLGGSIP